MKQVVRVVTLFIFNFPLLAQMDGNRGCGTILPPPFIQFLKEKPYKNLRNFDLTTTYWVPTTIHIICKDDSSGCYPLIPFFQNMCEVQASFSPANIQFFFPELLQDVQHHYSTDAWNNTNNALSDLISNNMKSQRMNMFIMGNGDACGATVCGCVNCCVFDAITLNPACVGPQNTTIQHEIGHWLCLPHTFDEYFSGCRECVDRSNCDQCGDMFCDTEADYLDYRWGCPYNGNLMEPTTCPLPTEQLNPDPTLFMSYANDNCTNRFSGEQILHMRALIQTGLNSSQYGNWYDRTWIKSYAPTPPSDTIEWNDTVLYGEITRNIAISGHLLIWKSVTNASHYLIEAIGTNFIRDWITTDTFFFIPQLPPNDQVTIFVKPLNSTYFCVPPVQFTVNTSYLALRYSIDTPKCSGKAIINFSVPNDTTNGQIIISNLQTGKISLISKPVEVTMEGFHKFWLFNAYGDSVFAWVPVFNISPKISITGIQEQNDSLKANVSLSPSKDNYPITYHWILPSGETISGKDINAVVASEAGTYTLVVTTSEGCSDTAQYQLAEPLSPQQPTAWVQQLDNKTPLVNIKASGEFSFELKVYSRDGKLVFSTKGQFPQDNSISLPPLAPGMYTLSILTEQGKELKSNFIIH